jgi:predicted signal transduction protein with EAL and GGDEF domain
LHAAAPVILPQKSLFNLRVDTMEPLLGPVGAHLIGGGLRVRALSAPCAIDGHEVRIGVTIGIAFAPRDGVTFDRLAATKGAAASYARVSHQSLARRLLRPSFSRMMGGG